MQGSVNRFWLDPCSASTICTLGGRINFYELIKKTKKMAENSRFNVFSWCKLVVSFGSKVIKQTTVGLNYLVYF